jgi:hypothetical protein
MLRMALRHWTGILIAAVLLWWALFYVPTTPSFALFQLKRAVDARDGNAAAQYVNFDSVVRNAGYEMMQKNEGALGQFLGKGAVDLLAHPAAELLKAWAVKQVNDGAKDVQMPALGVLGAMVMMHREGNTASTQWTDRKGRTWGVHMGLNDAGVWQVTEVDHVQELLARLKNHEEKNWDSK